MAALWSVAASACVGWAGDPVAVRDELSVLRPSEPGTYRLVGTARDSRTGATRRVVETYSVQPYFTRDGRQHQITDVRDSEGMSRTWETVFRPTGAYRLREAAGEASWRWEPPVLTTAAPLHAGRTWTSESTATLPDLAGTRRATSLTARSEVVDTASVTVGGTRLFAFVIEADVTTTVTDTNRVTGEATTFVTRTEGRTWFATGPMRVVKSSGTTTVDGHADGRYAITREVEIEAL